MMAIAIDVAMFHVYLKMGLVPKYCSASLSHRVLPIDVNFTPC